LALIEEKVKPLTRGQEKLIKALRDRKASVVGVFGPTGTGKSLLTACFAYDALWSGLYERVIYAKPVIDVSTGRETTIQELGEKFEEILESHLHDLFTGLVDAAELDGLISKGKIQLSDTHYIRGRTFDKTFIILDDAQNTSSEAIVEAISRLGMDSKLVIIGDPIFQSAYDRNPVLEARSLLLKEQDAAVVDLGLKDIVRPGAKKGLKLLLELKMRKRQMSEEEMKVKQTYELIAPDVAIVTIVDTGSLKKKLGLGESAPAPDYLVVVKEGHHGRAVGKNGERINRLERELGIRARVAEASLDFVDLIRAIHPLPKAVSAVSEVDIEGGDLVLYVEPGEAGPLIGQKGVYIRFVDAVLHKLLGMGVLIKEEEKQHPSR